MPPFVPSAGIGVLNVALSNFMKAVMTGTSICNRLAPPVPVGQRSFQYLQLGKESRRLVQTTRTPGGRPRQSKMSWSTDNYVVKSHALSTDITREAGDNAALLNFNAKQGAVKQLTNQITLRREADVRDMIVNNATNTEAYTTGTSQWSDFTGHSHPISDVRLARLQVKKAAGVDPTFLVVGPDVLEALGQHPDLIERFKYTNADGSLTIDQISKVLGVNVVEGNLVAADGNDVGDWLWKQLAVLAYVAPVTSQEDISALKTFVLDAGGESSGYEVLEFPDPYPDAKTDWVSVDVEYDVKLTAQESLFVFNNVVADAA